MENLPVIGISAWAIAKWFVVFAFALYLVFAFVVIKQVNLMTGTLELTFEKPIKLLAWMHFLFAVGVLIIALLIL